MQYRGLHLWKMLNTLALHLHFLNLSQALLEKLEQKFQKAPNTGWSNGKPSRIL